MNNKVHILVVDDDTEIRNLLVQVLKSYNYEVSSAKDGVELFEIIEQQEIHLIILDIMLPGEDGLVLCQKLRNITKIPIIMLTAAGSDTDRIVGLELGADDYMAKPFNPRELVARIKAVLRRTNESISALVATSENTSQATEGMEFNNWMLALHSRKLVSPDGIDVDLSSGEYVLLKVFVNAPQQVLSRDQLLDYTQHRASGPFDRSIDVQVSRLRQKIEVNPKKPALIKTVRGGGYVFTAKVKKVSHAHAVRMTDD